MKTFQLIFILLFSAQAIASNSKNILNRVNIDSIETSFTSDKVVDISNFTPFLRCQSIKQGEAGGRIDNSPPIFSDDIMLPLDHFSKLVRNKDQNIYSLKTKQLISSNYNTLLEHTYQLFGHDLFFCSYGFKIKYTNVKTQTVQTQEYFIDNLTSRSIHLAIEQSNCGYLSTYCTEGMNSDFEAIRYLNILEGIYRETSGFATYFPEIQNIIAITSERMKKFNIKYNTITNTLAFIPLVDNNFTQKFYDLNIKLLNDYEKFWRNYRLGITEKSVDNYNVTFTKSNGPLVGASAGYLLFGPAGAVFGAILGNKPPKATIYVNHSNEQILPPDFSTDSFFRDINNRNPKMFSSNDLDLYEFITSQYKKHLLAMKPLEANQIAFYIYLKNIYSPHLDKLIDLILSTDYENQGICVRDGNCHLNLYLKTLGKK